MKEPFQNYVNADILDSLCTRLKSLSWQRFTQIMRTCGKITVYTRFYHVKIVVDGEELPWGILTHNSRWWEAVLIEYALYEDFMEELRVSH